MVSEQTVAFTLMDYEELLKKLLAEKIISNQEYIQTQKSINLILNRCGFIKEEV